MINSKPKRVTNISLAAEGRFHEYNRKKKCVYKYKQQRGTNTYPSIHEVQNIVHKKPRVTDRKAPSEHYLENEGN